MIATDQPACFPDDLIVMVSSKHDATMLDRTVGIHNERIVANRRDFCAAAGVAYDDTVYQRIMYSDGASYDVIREVDERAATRYKDDVHADALITDQLGVALFLPIADCVPTVIYDRTRRVLALAHLGRHSTYANLARKLIEYMTTHGSRPDNLTVWMGPHAGKQNYKLQWFDRESDREWQGFFEKKRDGIYLDLAGYNKAQFVKTGVLEVNIHVSSADTVTNPQYFSHSMGETSGRIAVVAMMR